MRKTLVTRRELIASAVVAGAYAAVPPAWGRGLLKGRRRVGPGEFLDGVASGEPSENAVTFWSRLDTDRPRSGARLVVARDADMRDVVATSIVPTGAGLNGTLKVRVGRLEPSTEYHYLWQSGTDVSEVGRTRTAPAAGSAESVRIAYSSCQQFALGYFAAHAHAATIPDLDLYLFLGDYVYEGGFPNARIVRADGIDGTDLETYRRKYQLYRQDPGLRELHRLHPIAHIWDDHEIANNYSNTDPEAPEPQRWAGRRAAFEWLPRMTFPTERHRIYKRLQLGRMADVFLLDERQYRTGYNDGQPRRMLGDDQLQWLIANLEASPATWKVIGQQVVMAQTVYGEEEVRNDPWDGYPEDRVALLSEIERRGIDNVIVLTGDAHAFITNVLASDFQSLADDDTRKPAAVEYVGGSVTSPGRNVDELSVQAIAPWNQQYDGSRRGYAQLDLTPEAAVTEYRQTPVTSPDAPTTAFERFTQPVGTNRPVREPPSQVRARAAAEARARKARAARRARAARARRRAKARAAAKRA